MSKYPQEKRLEWKEIVLKQKESGLSIKKWCHQNQIGEGCFHYWKNHFFPKPAFNKSSFTELVDITEKNIFIEYKGLRIYLDKNFNPALLKRCLSTLKEFQC